MIAKKQKTKVTLMTQDEQEDFDERAGILEFCAGLKREEAERKAREIIGIKDETDE